VKKRELALKRYKMEKQGNRTYQEKDPCENGKGLKN
jgi:hypothetical protein